MPALYRQHREMGREGPLVIRMGPVGRQHHADVPTHPELVRPRLFGGASARGGGVRCRDLGIANLTRLTHTFRNRYARKIANPPGGAGGVEPGRWPQFEGPGCCDNSGLPRGRFDIGFANDPTFAACTGVVRKKQPEETAGLPPFPSQIAEVARRLATPQWGSCTHGSAPPGDKSRAMAMDGSF